MGINWALLAATILLAYLINVLVANEATADRFLLRAPIVAVFAALLYGLITAVVGEIAGCVAAVAVAWCDMTPGKLLGKHT